MTKKQAKSRRRKRRYSQLRRANAKLIAKLIQEKSEITTESKQLAEFEKANYDLSQLLKIAQSFCRTIELNTLIESIIYSSMAQMRVLGAGMFVLEGEDSGYYTFKQEYSSGIDVQPGKEYKISIYSPLISVISMVSDASDDKSFTLAELETKNLSDDEGFQTIKSLNPSLVIPLLVKNRVKGILFIGDRIFIDGMTSEYDAYDRKVISDIASLAAIAVNNASLIEQSSTDAMTKLKLKHFFFNVLADRIDETMRTSNSLSVIMFDIDYFKKFNDTYGHACGDYVLTTVAKIIRDEVRASDMASRYGGEEFTVMLNGADSKDAIMIAERIRKKIDETDFFYEDNHMHVTISGGISVFNMEINPVTSAKILVDQADKALYASKRNGRNQITYLTPAQLATAESHCL